MGLIGLIVLSGPLVGSLDAWLVLTLAGLATGMLLFTMASGLTLVFGLMDVLNFGHGAFISVGAFAAAAVIAGFGGFPMNPFAAIGLLLLAALIAALVAGVGGAIFEKFLIRRVYGNHMLQILITLGGLIIIEQLLIVIFGPEEVILLRPEILQGSFLIGEVALERYRLVVVLIGLLIFTGLELLLNKTKLGLLIRAGVENREMVEALGYRTGGLFIGVFIAGSMLAGMGGALWAYYQELFTYAVGSQITLVVFIVIIIGGLGSVTGCFFAALLAGLVVNYATYIQPASSSFALIGLLALVLMLLPQGLHPVAKR